MRIARTETLMAISIHCATVFDENALQDFVRSGQSEASGCGPIRDALRSNDCWIAMRDENLLGYAMRGEFFEHDILRLVFVGPEHRRRGVGSALIGAIERACRSDRLFCCLSESNSAMLRMLEQRGYAASGKVHDLVMDESRLFFVKRFEAASEA
jgi:GNAT superfamily N-acetyltransferase